MIARFETCNMIKIARDELSRWKQIKDVSSFKENFLKILLHIPTITVDEQLDRYDRGLKNYFWKELCTEEYTLFSELIRDAERAEMVYRRFRKPAPKFWSSVKTTHPKSSAAVPIEIRNH